MGILSRIRGRSATPAPLHEAPRRFEAQANRPSTGSRERVVTVAFRPLDDVRPLPNPWPWSAYSYTWSFSVEPSIGDWAIAPGEDGPTPVVVVSLDRTEASREMTLKSLIRPMTHEEVQRVQRPVRERTLRYLAHARSQAGLLPLQSDLEPAAGQGFTALVSPRGDATRDQANAHADAWFQAARLARQMGRDDEEVEALAEAGRYWSRLSSRHGREQHMQDFARELDRVDVAHVAAALGKRTPAQVHNWQLAGKPLPDWLEVVQALERTGRGEEAVQLVELLITAAEQEAALSGREPAPAYTERAAIMFRRRKDYDAEVRVLERWERSCPPAQRGPGAAQQKLASRLAKAKLLAAKTPRP